jgi:MoaA/NifB/PqqE/SkfB family radical SAM enzyme
MNEKFCILPFIHLSTRPDGNPRICSDGAHAHMPQVGNLNKISLNEFWNGEGLKEFRKNMLEGNDHPYCEMCMTVEKGGGRSKRQGVNDKYLDLYQHKVEYAKNNNGTMEHGPAHWEFRLSKKCNLACLSCSPTNSTLIQTQYNKNYDLLPEYDKQVLFAANKQKDDSKFIENIWDHLDSINKIELHGGEPFYDENCLDILEEIGKRKPNNNIELLVHTNMSFINDRIISILNNFNRLNFQMSIDGFEYENEFIRWPSKWKIIEKNLMLAKKIKTNNYFKKTVSVTVSPYNCLSLDMLFEWVFKTHPDYDIQWFPTIFPKRFNLSLVPLEKRKLQVEKLQNMKHLGNVQVCKNIDYISGFLLKDDNIDDKVVIDFVEYNKSMDKIRDTDALATFPHLESIYTRYETIKRNHN